MHKMRLDSKMIEVHAELLRGNVYIGGETVECRITFTAHNVSGGAASHSDGSQVEVIAWASAQIHCQRTVSESRVIIPKLGGAEAGSSRLESDVYTTSGTNSSEQATSFIPTRGESGQCVAATTPKILFCDLTLAPGDSCTFLYSEKLSPDGPPSYKGQAVKYSYKLTIGTQRVGAAIKLLYVPIRVLLVHGLQDISVYRVRTMSRGEDGGMMPEGGSEPADDGVQPSNPFLQTNKHSSSSMLDIALQVLDICTGRKLPSSYSISNERGCVSKFTLFKQAYKLGEDIIGTFDFSDATIPCVQFSVTLQCVEEVAEECTRKPHHNLVVTSHSKYHEYCLHTTSTYLSLPIPVTAYPSFITDIVSVKWRLHFEFVTTVSPISDHIMPEQANQSSMWQGPPILEVESMVWDLPVKICATNPVLVSAATPTRPIYTVTF